MGRKRRKEAYPTPEELHALFRHNPKHRFLIRRVNQGRRGRAGDIAGGVSPKGYFQVSVFGRTYGAHNVIWCMVTGEWPNSEMDHRDGNKLNNRWDNLRLANSSQNQCNRRKSKSNTSGFKGVYWNKRHRKWRAKIGVFGKQKYLGFFKTPEAAFEAYKSAALELHGEFARFE